MGLFRQKNSPNIWMSFTINKRQYKRSTGSTDKKVAEKIYEALKAKIALNQWHPEMEQKQEFTFKELADKFEVFAKGRVTNYKKSIGCTLSKQIDKFGNILLSDFNSHLIETYQTSLIDAGYSVATINRYMFVIKRLFSKAHEWEMISDHTLKQIRKVKNLKGANKRLRYLSKEECITLITECDNHLKPIVITALNTGMRKSEILSLEREKHLDMRHGFILLDKTKNKERREIPINPTLRDTLQRIPQRLDSPYVFYDPATGKPYGDVKKSFKSSLRRAGIKDFHFHDLRHTFASHLVMAGVDLTTVSRLLGHKSLTMTLRYAHLAPSHITEAVNKLTDILGQKDTVLEAKNQSNYPNFSIVEANSLTAVSKTA
ncbi:MAG: site-specific integrase [Nitrospinae bacterium]|nr:site-specific integrase [Nitrospinota bacterium]